VSPRTLSLPACALVALASAPFSLLEARTWVVRADGSGDAPTLQAALQSAASGDVIQAEPGVYRESLDFLGKAVHVKGSGTDNTLLDASLAQSAAVVFQGGESRDAVLEGFSIMNGTGVVDGTARVGGAIAVLDAEPTIRGNRLVKNMASYGAGIYCRSSGLRAPLIENNLIEDNVAEAGGGAVAVDGHAAPVIRKNALLRNEADRGGAVWFSGADAQPVLEENEIRLNLAQSLGGGIYGQGAAGNTALVRNLLEANVSRGLDDQGGGAILLDHVAAEVSENTIVRNKVLGTGGSLVLLDSPASVIERNVLAYSQTGVGIRCSGAGASIRNNLLWQNAAEEAEGDCADWWTVDGNIVADPELCGLDSGDYHPAAGSPALMHPAGPLGAYAVPGCSLTPTRPATWGSLKSRY
jgi:hypothetical protein